MRGSQVCRWPVVCLLSCPSSAGVGHLCAPLLKHIQSYNLEGTVNRARILEQQLEVTAGEEKMLCESIKQ